ncbi:transcription initiation factor TFIID subunit A-domain-containing protein, partial [Zychaea mexicana]|uniref:transcription initiation factor TFIID subunit A-domain-containing protein n=1 Tax=Zychaea mexicana TaxID=64656 RepID=UPI0022FDDED0
VRHIDPSERLEPEIQLEIADEFIDSVIKFVCRLAKHRKSDTLEVKDLLGMTKTPSRDWGSYLTICFS